MQSWLDVLTQSTRELEPPERFFWWSGVAAISAILRKNVWINRFSYTLYPNVYVLLVSAKSGLRKGLPVDYAKSIVDKLECTRVIAGRNSVQGVVKELSEQRTLENGRILTDAQAFLCAPELGSFMVRDQDALTILTDLYNTHEHAKSWKNTLKNSPVEALKSPCITLLGASNVPLFDDLVKGKDMEGGFIARTFVIYEKERRSINSLMFRPEFLVPKEELSDCLKRLLTVTGEFKIPEVVKHQYNDWYKYLAGNSYDDRTGTLERLGDQVLKLSMIISMAKSNELVIDEESMAEAIAKCEEFFTGTKLVSMGQGTSEIAPAVTRVLRCLLAAEDNTMERQKIMRKIWPDVDSVNFDRVMDTIGEISGTWAVHMYRGKDRKIYYKLNESVAAAYKNFKGEE